MESAGTLLTILTPLVAVPLTMITFYLRSLREHQISRHAEVVRRLESAESALGELRKALTEFERDYTSKEEWLRECMLARRTLEQLREATVRIETTVQNLHPNPSSQRVPKEDRTRVCPVNQKDAGRSGGCDKDNH